jgi:hypothetical protein
VVISGDGNGGTFKACVALNNVGLNVYDIAIGVGGDHYTDFRGACPMRAGASD